MLKALLLLSWLVTTVLCQTASSCGATSFRFYNGYDPNGRFTEQQWDWETDNFSDGTDDTFDGYLYLHVTAEDTLYRMEDYGSNPTDSNCNIGTTDPSSYSSAFYLYQLGGNLQLRRDFYAPRSSKFN